MAKLFIAHAMKTLALDVNRDVIMDSVKNNFNKCMVAESLHRKYPNAKYIHVDASIIRFTNDGVRYWFLPPQSVKNAIAAFDNHQPVKPFKFVTVDRVKAVQAGFYATHPKGDNRTNPSKRYFRSQKRRRYATRERINGICVTTPA
jgi:hypothetical protein